MKLPKLVPAESAFDVSCHISAYWVLQAIAKIYKKEALLKVSSWILAYPKCLQHRK